MKIIVISVSFWAVLSINGMQNQQSISRAQEGLEWLTKSGSSHKDEVVFVPQWQFGMCFLTSYMKKEFTEYRVHEDCIFFNGCERTTTYKMTLPEIKNFLIAAKELYARALKLPAHPEGPQADLRKKYFLLLRQLEQFNKEHPAYCSAWLNGDWQEIRQKVQE